MNIFEIYSTARAKEPTPQKNETAEIHWLSRFFLFKIIETADIDHIKSVETAHMSILFFNSLLISNKKTPYF